MHDLAPVLPDSNGNVMDCVGLADQIHLLAKCRVAAAMTAGGPRVTGSLSAVAYGKCSGDRHIVIRDAIAAGLATLNGGQLRLTSAGEAALLAAGVVL
jgi:hypothetical protein